VSTPELAALPPVTEELLTALEFRYADPRVCRVCGAPLQLADTKGMKMTCTSDAASPYTSVHEAAGATWKEALHHWSESTLYNPPDGDLRVIALVAEVRRLHIAEHPAGKESCPSCGSGSRAELAYVPGRTGQPVSCSDDWHDEDAREPGSQELPR
jgi:hypothetical protein